MYKEKCSVHKKSRERWTNNAFSIANLSLIFLAFFALSGCDGAVSTQKNIPAFLFSSNETGNSEIYLYHHDDPYTNNLTNNKSKDQSPVWSPDNTEIAFISDRDGNFELFTMRADGSNTKRITNNNSDEFSPAWSPDKKLIAYETTRSGTFQIYVINTNTLIETRLTYGSSNNLRPSWSPDGTRIAFSSDRNGNFEIYYMDLETFDIRQITDDPHADTQPQWSPDGSEIAFISNRDGSDDVFTMNQDGANYKNISHMPGIESMPVWSDDGTILGFEYLNGEQNDIYIYHFPSRSTMQVTSTSHSDHYPAFIQASHPENISLTISPPLQSQNTACIVYTFLQNNISDIYMMDENGLNKTRLTETMTLPPTDITPSWSPDRRTIAYASTVGGGMNIYLHDIESDISRKLTNSTGFDSWPTWAPSNAQLAYTSDADGDYEIYIIGVDGSGFTKITENVYTDRDPTWAPNSERIAFTSDRNGNFDIFIMDTAGTILTQVTDHPAKDSMPAWSPDGTELVFSSDRDGDLELYRISLLDEKIIQLTENDFNDQNPSWSPDGKSIIFESDTDGKSTVYLLDLENKNISPVSLPKGGSSAGARWSPDSKYIVYTSDMDGDFDIYAHFLRESKSYFITHNALAQISPVLSPDGEKIAFSCANGFDFDICVMNTDGSAIRSITDDPADDNFPSWSPDSKMIVFSSNRSGNFEIYMTNLETTEVIQVTDQNNMSCTDPSWAPNGKFIAYSMFYGDIISPSTTSFLVIAPFSPDDIMVSEYSITDLFGLDSGSNFNQPIVIKPEVYDHSLGIFRNFGYFRYPSWSTNSKRILFQGEDLDSGLHHILQLEPFAERYGGGWNIKPLLPDVENSYMASWSPDDTQVVFSSNINGNEDIYRVNTDGTGLKRLTSDQSGEGYANWGIPSNASNPGEDTVHLSGKIAYVQETSYPEQVHLFDLDTMEFSVIEGISSEIGNQFIEISDKDINKFDPLLLWVPEHGRIPISISASYNDPERSTLTYYSLDTFSGESQLVPDSRQESIFPIYNPEPVWSPDGEYLVFVTGDYPNKQIRITDKSLSQSTLITDTLGTSSVTWSPDSKQFAWICPIEGDNINKWTLCFSDTSGSGVSTAEGISFDNFVCHPIWSPDGQSIALIESMNEEHQPQISQIKIYDFETQQLSGILHSKTSDIFDIAWSASGDKIFYALEDSDMQNIFSVNLDGTGRSQISFGQSTIKKIASDNGRLLVLTWNHIQSMDESGGQIFRFKPNEF